jgi:hypothetical protein
MKARAGLGRKSKSSRRQIDQEGRVRRVTTEGASGIASQAQHREMTRRTQLKAKIDYHISEIEIERKMVHFDRGKNFNNVVVFTFQG